MPDKVKKKAAPQMKHNAAPQMGHSPAEMSPYKMGHSPTEMESAKQERKNLLDINPIAKHASGGSWMSKHSNSALNFNAPKHKHKHPKGDDRAYKGHTGNAPTSSNTSKKDLAKMGSKAAPQMGHDSPAKHKGSVHGAKHSEEVGHDGTGIHSHSSGKQKKRDDQMAAAEKRKKVKATVKAGKAIAKSM